MRFIITSFFLFLVFGCGPKEELRTIYGNAFGTTYSIKAYSAIEAETLQSQVDSLVEQVNGSISTYDPRSIISRLNGGESSVVADDYFKEV